MQFFPSVITNACLLGLRFVAQVYFLLIYFRFLLFHASDHTCVFIERQ